jgi:hypothetical protein
MELPKVFIWRPENEDDVGHVALKTDKYYVSIWPARYLNDGKPLSRWMDIVRFMNGVEGSLVLNINVDREREGDCDPVEYDIDVAVTNEDLNPIIEEFLLYNEINPEDVTLKRGEELFLKRQEYENLSPEEAENVIEPQQPETSLLKTQYSFSAELFSGKEVAEPFYHKQQSCVSLIFNLLQVAWLKHHPDRPIPIADPEIVEGFPSNNQGEVFYKVTWFDSVVQQYFMSISNNTGPTTGEPGIVFLYASNQIYFLFKIVLPIFLILAIFSYFYPFLRFPLLVGYCIINQHPISIIHFVIGLFIILLSYIYPEIPFTKIVVFYIVYEYIVLSVRFLNRSKRMNQSKLGRMKLLFEIMLNVIHNLGIDLSEKLGIV